MSKNSKMNELMKEKQRLLNELGSINEEESEYSDDTLIDEPYDIGVIEDILDDDYPEDDENLSQYEENQDEEKVNNFDRFELLKESPKSSRKRVVSKELHKPDKSTSYTLTQARKDIKELLSSYSKDIEKMLKNYQFKYRKFGNLSESEIDNMVDSYNDKRNNIENEINIIIDSLDNDPSESFYKWIEDYLERQKSRVEKLL